MTKNRGKREPVAQPSSKEKGEVNVPRFRRMGRQFLLPQHGGLGLSVKTRKAGTGRVGIISW